MSNIKIDNNKFDSIIKNSEEKNLNQPSTENITDFENTLNEQPNSNNSNKEKSQNSYNKNFHEQYSQNNNEEQILPSFENIFKNSFALNTITQTQETKEINTPENQILEKLVDRILVADTKNGQNEVRIKIGENILKDTEIIIIKDIQGNLKISLNSNDPNSIQHLVTQQYDLKNRLEQIEKCNISVEVNTETSQEQENNANQESRGLFNLYEQYKNNFYK